jgi:hypothetical protein
MKGSISFLEGDEKLTQVSLDGQLKTTSFVCRMKIMEAILAALCLIFFWAGVELSGRKKIGMKPNSFGQLFSLVAAKGEWIGKEGQRALLFALFCTLCFALWESILWKLFGREASLIEQFLAVTGVGLASKGLFDRFKRFYWLEEQTQPNALRNSLLLFLAGLAFLLGSWVTLVLLGPWVYFRFINRGVSKSRHSG